MDVAKELRQRVGVVRRLATSMSRGPLLNEIAKATVIGKAQCCAYVTRPIQLQDHTCTDDGGAQVALNDLARVLLGAQRSDHIRTSELLNRAGIPSLNEIVIRQSAIAAWKAINVKGAPLSLVLQALDSRTRGGQQGLVNPVSPRCTAASNMAIVWNKSQALRSAKTLQEAQKVAKKISKTLKDM